MVNAFETVLLLLELFFNLALLIGILERCFDVVTFQDPWISPFFRFKILAFGYLIEFCHFRLSDYLLSVVFEQIQQNGLLFDGVLQFVYPLEYGHLVFRFFFVPDLLISFLLLFCLLQQLL